MEKNGKKREWIFPFIFNVIYCDGFPKTDELKEKHRQLQLPIPHGGKFCEVKTCRLESWGLQDYHQSGWVPVTPTSWRSLSQQASQPPPEAMRKRRGRTSSSTEIEETVSKTRRRSEEESNERSNKENFESENQNVPAQVVVEETGDTEAVKERRKRPIKSQTKRGKRKTEQTTRTLPKMRVLQTESHNNVEDSPDESELQPYDELFFCYVCKSIFVSNKALENHQFLQHSM